MWFILLQKREIITQGSSIPSKRSVEGIPGSEVEKLLNSIFIIVGYVIKQNLQPNLDAKELIIAIYVSYNPEEKSPWHFRLYLRWKFSHRFVYNANYLLTFCQIGSPCSQRKVTMSDSFLRPTCLPLPPWDLSNVTAPSIFHMPRALSRLYYNQKKMWDYRDYREKIETFATDSPWLQ